MRCPECGAENADNARFCSQCGLSMNVPARAEEEVKEANVVSITPPAETTRKFAVKSHQPVDDDINVAPKKNYVSSSYGAVLTNPVESDDEEFNEESDDEYEEHSGRHSHHRKKSGALVFFTTLLCILTAALLAVCFLSFTKMGQKLKATVGLNAPAEAYWEVGDDALKSGDVTAAVKNYEAAFSRDPNSYEGAMKLAQTLVRAGDSERAERAYRKAITLKPKETEPYGRILELMNERSASREDMVNTLRTAFTNTADEEYKTRLQDYAPETVAFSYEGGEYKEDLLLEMTSSEGAVIYYTLDGSQPSDSSDVYAEPIALTEGETRVRAIAYQFELKSGETNQSYAISYQKAFPPVFKTKEGIYDLEAGIESITVELEATNGETIYYTTDYTVPTTESTEYTGPISLPVGSYTIRAICVKDGEASEETDAHYAVVADLEPIFSDEDSFKSIKIGETPMSEIKGKKWKITEKIGDINTDEFATWKYAFGEIDFSMIEGEPFVTAVRMTDDDLTGVRGIKVGDSADVASAKFRKEPHGTDPNGERVLYSFPETGDYGWETYTEDGELTGVHYQYQHEGMLVELHFLVEGNTIVAIEYCISEM